MPNVEDSDGKQPLEEVVSKIRRGACNADDLWNWFRIDPDWDAASTTPGPFADGRVRLNTDAVDASGLEALAEGGANALATDAIRVVRNSSLHDRRRMATNRAKPSLRIVAEGDSWFNLPDIRFPLLIPPTMIDLLPADWSVVNIGHHGDTLADIAIAREWDRHLGSDTDAFLFSAGGNDVLGGGRFGSLIRQRRSGDNDPGNASRYIAPAFHEGLRQIEAVLRRLVEKVLGDNPGLQMFMHGYDYVEPLQTGHWLGRHLVDRGFDPIWQRDFCVTFVRIMLDHFNQMLGGLDRRFSRFHHVDLRGGTKGEWWGELHPNGKGAGRLARMLETRISATVGRHGGREVESPET